ncbi:MAG: GntR family transcriptional regulator [Deltaproteobacteria bacterium]|nr:GntR family transcriptional regulator [Deltaproteobacteria bacterium]
MIEEIVTGQLNPGERLSEGSLAGRFHVSRTPIREALLQLEKLGYVVHQKNVGTIVKKVSPEGVREIFEVVASLEGMAVELFGKLPPAPEDMQELIQLQQELRQDTLNHDFASYYEGNRKFHDFLARKSGNRTLLDLTRTHRDSIYRIVARGSTLPLHIQDYLTGHDAIIEALQKGESQKAGTIMKDHVLKAGELISGAMAPLPWRPSS